MTHLTLPTMMAVEISDWLVPLGVAAVPAIASIVAAVLSARSARKSRLAEMDAARINELENRLSERKYDLYRPMIDLLRKMMDTSKTGTTINQKQMQRDLSEFGAWINIFGSDEAIRAFHNFMQGAYHSAPPQVLMRLYADFILAARRDMGYQNTATTAQEILGIRINDIYESPEMQAVASMTFMDLCAHHNWPIPWQA